MSKKEVILYLFVLLPVFLLGLNGAVHLASVPNDLAVYGGYVLFLAIVGGAVFAVYRIVSRLLKNCLKEG